MDNLNRKMLFASENVENIYSVYFLITYKKNIDEIVLLWYIFGI